MSPENAAHLDERVQVDWYVEDSQGAEADDIICKLVGPARALLTGERTALNFLQTLSATATRTRQYVDAIKGTQAKILDTRKTIPGLRLAQKYAVSGIFVARYSLPSLVTIPFSMLMVTCSPFWIS